MMTIASYASEATFSAGEESTVSDYLSLLKPGVMSLVVFTAITGLVIAPGSLHPLFQLIAVLCIALGSGGGAALNMWYDRDIDAIMLRTSARPVASGRITPGNALAFGMVMSVVAVMVMGLALNWLAAGLLAFAIFFYAGIYTVGLKRYTAQNIVIGGAAGAFPPVIGWTAVTGDVSLYACVMFAIIFLWTPPHFWALALFRNGDYQRANIPMLPVTKGIEATTRQMLAYTVMLVAVSLIPVFAGWQGMFYGVGVAALGAWFLFHAVRVWRQPIDGYAKKMFGVSILYLFAVFSCMMADNLLAGYL